MTTTLDERLDATFSALSNSTRRAIMARLAEGEATVMELAEPFELTLPAISKHLKVLEDARLIQRGRRAQFRPCSLDPEAFDAAMDWAATCRDLWSARLDRLGTHLARTTEENQL